MCEAYGLVRMTSYRTGRSLRDNRGQRDNDAAGGTSGLRASSVALTTRFLALCQEYGAERLAVSIVAAGRSTGIPGLPHNNDWTAWNADEMRAASKYLERKRRGR